MWVLRETNAANDSPTSSRLCTRAGIQDFVSQGRQLMTLRERVYDITEFAKDHPGGAEILIQFAGEDIGDLLTFPSTMCIPLLLII
jgi:hypothetical protein